MPGLYTRILQKKSTYICADEVGSDLGEGAEERCQQHGAHAEHVHIEGPFALLQAVVLHCVHPLAQRDVLKQPVINVMMG